MANILKHTLRALIVSALLLLPLRVAGTEQQEEGNYPSVHISLAPDSILIGDRAVMKVEVEKDFTQVVNPPQFENNIIGNAIEILAIAPIDTAEVATRRHRITYNYVLTSFEEGTFSLSNFPVLYLDKNITDTLYAPESIALTVGTLSVDTLNTTIYDIKAPIETPLLLGEVQGYIEFISLAGIVLAAIIYLIANRKRKEKAELSRALPTEPPHLKAIRELEALHNQKIWQNNKHKLYYTRLTDILREYLFGRYEIRAMEMTSDEIMDAVKEITLSAKNSGDLNKILRLADYVKFAKHIPTPEENEEAYYAAYYFVEETKQVAEQMTGEPEEMVVDITPAAVEEKKSE
ncbi:MAG: hypothetical protein J6Q40_05010 [Tidjanibacter sp.]|nr:hypothetical protein [Tidjanibacter sp.]